MVCTNNSNFYFQSVHTRQFTNIRGAQIIYENSAPSSVYPVFVYRVAAKDSPQKIRSIVYGYSRTAAAGWDPAVCSTVMQRRNCTATREGMPVYVHAYVCIHVVHTQVLGSETPLRT